MTELKKCPRCGNELHTYTLSRFNMEEICLDCAKREQGHPKYAKAYEAEAAAVRSGDYNFPGIGCPEDLYLLGRMAT